MKLPRRSDCVVMHGSTDLVCKFCSFRLLFNQLSKLAVKVSVMQIYILSISNYMVRVTTSPSFAFANSLTSIAVLNRTVAPLGSGPVK